MLQPFLNFSEKSPQRRNAETQKRRINAAECPGRPPHYGVTVLAGIAKTTLRQNCSRGAAETQRKWQTQHTGWGRKLESKLTEISTAGPSCSCTSEGTFSRKLTDPGPVRHHPSHPSSRLSATLRRCVTVLAGIATNSPLRLCVTGFSNFFSSRCIEAPFSP